MEVSKIDCSTGIPPMYMSHSVLRLEILSRKSCSYPSVTVVVLFSPVDGRHANHFRVGQVGSVPNKYSILTQQVFPIKHSNKCERRTALSQATGHSN